MFRRVRWVTLTITGVSLVAAACVHDVPTEGLINPAPGGFDSNTTQSEPHVAAWNDVIVAGWNDFKNGPLSYPRTAYGYSIDGGQTWVYAGALPAVDSLGNNPGDPVLAVDRAGTFYFATMAQDWAGSNYIGVAVAKTTPTTTAVQFGTPVLVAGADLTYLQDKPWLAVDTNDPAHSSYSGRVYLCWTDYTGWRPENPRKVIRFIHSTSTNPLQFGSESMSPFGSRYYGSNQQGPITGVISTSGKGCNIGIGPSGEVYVTWVESQVQTQGQTPTQKIYVVKSVHGGDNIEMETPVEVAVVTPSGSTEASAACDPYRALNGYVRAHNFPFIAVDRGGSFNGRVYIAFAAAEPGDNDAADVFVVQSQDGQTWSAPKAINKAPDPGQGKDEWFRDNWLPTIAVASDGTVAVSFYDRRDDDANRKIKVFIALSENGGSTWRNETVTSTAFDVPPLLHNLPDSDPVPAECYMGDYNGLTAVGTTFHLVWGDNSYLYQGRPDPNIAYRKFP